MESGSSSSGGDRFKLYEELELQEFHDKFVIKSVESPNRGFSIGRQDGNIEPLSEDTLAANPSKVSTIYGVVGTIRLLVGTYVIVITSRKEVGNFFGFPVYRVLSMSFLSCNEALKLSNSQEKRDEAYFRNLLKTVESTPGLYYSYETDITLNLQRRWKLAEGWMNKAIWKQADPRFVWNRNLLDELIECKLDDFVMPLLQGSFQTVQLNLKDSPAILTLVSRRCTRRLGTRMWRRGANLAGDVANFIETEQLLEIDGFTSSFMQIRGSIPLLWEQIVDLSYKPRLRVIDHEQTSLYSANFSLCQQSEVVERHFHDLLQRYGETIAVDLTDKHGDEGQLNAAFASEMQKLPHVRYVSFDFHHICGNSNFDNLQLLFDQISEEFEKQGYFLVDTDRNILAEQKGIIRSNCIDCLDRTNVTQSFLAQKSLNIQLQRIGVLDSSECISMFPEDYGKFRTVWAEQGDEISLQYAGTYALKGDLVRYGRQTITGAIKDGVSALSRYYLNNFHDGVRQDAMDLISGRYTVNKNGPSPFHLNGFETFSYLPIASALVVGGLTLTSLSIHQAGRNAQQYITTVLCAGVTAGVMAAVKANGRQFCSRPRLCGLL
ncbi:phosphoinositide phosphatase SAC8 isoform X1 [Ziziphus jujuba]|uniref:Phosphoinositide phosphatase SAC8 isoform X1 n=2 Tax=Ziziphus jujuba TaxID=326968 RepID=A0ABM4ABW1_ZIZJJ|nr:phosphoinositide phosphatase SAC8 isoform X1 [Ziziphus jujuba var. spinosa]XP_060674208.1 phosphoinositide phosphatase SAC8 isoform X1 [Ziziphus jujuba]